MSYCTDDVVVQHPIPKAIWPWAGRFRGKAQLKEFVTGMTGDYIHVYTLSEGLITSLKIFGDTGLVVSAMHP